MDVEPVNMHEVLLYFFLVEWSLTIYLYAI